MLCHICFSYVTHWFPVQIPNQMDSITIPLCNRDIRDIRATPLSFLTKHDPIRRNPLWIPMIKGEGVPIPIPWDLVHPQSEVKCEKCGTVGAKDAVGFQGVKEKLGGPNNRCSSWENPMGLRWFKNSQVWAIKMGLSESREDPNSMASHVSPSQIACFSMLGASRIVRQTQMSPSHYFSGGVCRKARQFLQSCNLANLDYPIRQRCFDIFP